jgi:hypothetical protein
VIFSYLLALGAIVRRAKSTCVCVEFQAAAFPVKTNPLAASDNCVGWRREKAAAAHRSNKPRVFSLSLALSRAQVAKFKASEAWFLFAMSGYI